jgi:hypothetical protein
MILEKEKYIKERLERQIDWYNKKAKLMQRYAQISDIVVIVSLGLLPMLLTTLDSKFNFISIGFSMIALMTFGISRLFNFKDNWVKYRSTAEILKKEQFLYFSAVEAYADQDTAFENLVQNVENIIKYDQISWINEYNKELRVPTIYFSYNFDNLAEYSKLKDLLLSAPNFNFRENSIPLSEFPNDESLKANIINQIRKSGCVITTTGSINSGSEWTLFELEQAKELRKPIIVIISHGEDTITTYASEIATSLIGWNFKSIVNSIRNIEETVPNIT